MRRPTTQARALEREQPPHTHTNPRPINTEAGLGASEKVNPKSCQSHPPGPQNGTVLRDEVFQKETSTKLL